MRYILLLFTTCLLYATDTKPFLITIDKPFDSVLYATTQNYDDTISAVGFSNNFKQKRSHKVYHNAFEYLADTSEHLYGKKSLLITINKNGKIIWEKFAKTPRFNEAVAITKTPQNGYFIGGFTFDGELLLAKLDANGNTLFAKTFGTKNYDRMSNLIALSDGGVLAVGSSTTSRDTHDPMFQTGLGLSDIFLTRFDQNGKMLWSKKYGTAYDDIGVDAAEAYDGSILVLASTRYEKNRNVTLMRISQNGDKIWLKHFQSQKLVDPKRLLALKDHTFLALLSQQDSMGKKQIHLIRFDLFNNVLKENTIDTYYSSDLNDIKEYANSTLIGVGEVRDHYNTDALVMILDQDLELLCQDHFGGENIDIFHGVTILRDSKALAVGETIPQNSQVKHIYIAKIKPDCSLDSMPIIQVNKDDIYKVLRKTFAKEIDTGELKITKDLIITMSAPWLYFKQGDYKLTSKQKSFLAHFSQKFSTFLQKYGSTLEAIEIGGHTSSEWSKFSSFDDRFLKNMDLSLKRSMSVTEFMVRNIHDKQKKDFTKLLKGSGYSYNKRVFQNGHEAKSASRRVTIKLWLKPSST